MSLFVELRIGSQHYKKKVSTSGCDDVDDWKYSIKNSFTPELRYYQTHHFSLLMPDGFTKIDPGEAVKNLFHLNNVTSKHPILIAFEVGKMSLDVIDCEALRNYRLVAEQLFQDPTVKKIMDVVSEISATGEKQIPSVLGGDSSRVPFIFVNASSGRGKTQMAFNLMHYNRNILRKNRKKQKIIERPVIYIVCSYLKTLKIDSDISLQPVYRAYKNPSKTFIECVKKDFDEHIKSAGDVERRPLYTFGFIRAYLEYLHNPELREQPYSLLDITELKEFLSSKNFEFPLIILDEYYYHIFDESDTQAMLRFFRNVFRAVGFPVIVMGTDSKATNLMEYSKLSRVGDAERTKCCYIVSELPKVCSLSLNLPKLKDTLLESIILNSRPWFAQLAANYIKQNSQVDIDGLLYSIHQSIHRVKPLTSYDGRRGQIFLFLNASYGDRGLIHGHFAIDNQSFYVLERSGNTLLQKDYDNVWKEWRPTAILPRPENDLLLFLTLMGGPDYPAISFGKERVSFSFAYDRILNDPETEKRDICEINIAEKGNDGMRLETVSAACVCLASHENGIAGSKVKDFLSSLIYELNTRFPKKRNPIPFTDQDLNFLDDLRIPFFSPPNAPWPSWLLDQDAKRQGYFLGNFERTVRKERIDFKSSEKEITCEAKDYSCPISLGTLAGILERVPTETRIHLVIVGKLQLSYGKFGDMTQITNIEFIRDHCIIRKLTPKGLEEIEGIRDTSQKPKCAVLFIEKFKLS